MPIDELELLDSEELSTFRKTRGPYKSKRRVSTPVMESELAAFQLISNADIEKAFELVTPEQFDSLPNEYERKAGTSKSRSIIFIDGEGSNDGDPTIGFRKNKLRRWVQKQNYSLLGATIQSNNEYRCIIGEENFHQLSTKQCLDFILGLPTDHVIIGYGLTYDVEHWLKDLRGTRLETLPDKMSPMERLMKTQSVWWHRYRIHYIPGKIFTVSKYKGSKKLSSRSVYDTIGFFQTSFKNAIASWDIGTKEERDFIERMKAKRPDFGPITDEVKEYNHQEGIHGIQMFARVRREYTNLGLSVPRPVGAGSIASAFYRKHGLENYYPKQWLLPRDTVLSAFFGGRFDVTRIGFVGNVIEYDINSAYPYIASTLPCLHCGRYVTAHNYEPSSHSLWLTRWRDNGTRWSPFPYRTESNHIRYYSNGIGWYYNNEVAAALRFDPTIEVLGGFTFEKNCDHQPFDWIPQYYERRQQMLREGDFGEKIIKLGLNAAYGKLAQSKGMNPRWQQLIWAGLITSGTRAMILDGIRQFPDHIIKVATDAIFSSVRLDLPIHPTTLGSWKSIELYDLFVLGNGVYNSRGSNDSKHPFGISKTRGFDKEGTLKFDWERIREDYQNGRISLVMKKEFRRFVKAFHEKKMEERCNWIDIELELKLDTNKSKRIENELIYPVPNPTPTVISTPTVIKNLNEPES